MIYTRPKRNEANIQAEFYHQCRINKINCCLEYRHGHCVFDVVILDEKKQNVLYIVEIKHWEWQRYYDITKSKSKQFKKYRSFDVPMYLIHNFDLIAPTIADIKLKLGIL